MRGWMEVFPALCCNATHRDLLVCVANAGSTVRLGGWRCSEVGVRLWRQVQRDDWICGALADAGRNARDRFLHRG